MRLAQRTYPMMPDHPLEPAKAAGRVRRLARKAAVGLLQISLGAACLVGTYWGVTRFLAGDFERMHVQPTFGWSLSDRECFRRARLDDTGPSDGDA